MARLVVLLALLLVLSGCLGLGHGRVFKVSIVNDTSRPVVVRDCDTYCSSSPIAIDLQPGGSTAINRIANDHKFFSITDASGGHVGCLDLYFPKPEPGARFDVSGAFPCPGPQGRPWTDYLVGAVLLALALALGLVFARRTRSR